MFAAHVYGIDVAIINQQRRSARRRLQQGVSSNIIAREGALGRPGRAPWLQDKMLHVLHVYHYLMPEHSAL